MSKKTTVKYADFADSIDMDSFEAAIGFEVMATDGEEDIGKCPDLWGMHKHGDTTGKFAINREKKVYHCFLCGGGNLLSLAMEWNELDEDDAADWLRQFAHGDTRSDAEYYEHFKDFLAARYKAEKMPYFNAHVLEQFEHRYVRFFAERGISDEVFDRFKLGYGAHHKKPAPMRNGEKIDDDYYGPCIVFPHVWSGQLVGWQHRWLDHGKNTPKWLGKYTNTSDFPKHTTLYNYDEAIKRNGPVIVVESVPTVLFLESYGYHAVCSFGAGIKEEQLQLLRRFDHVLVAPDNDKPGHEFATTISDYLDRWTNVEVLPYFGKEGEDIGDLATYIEPQDISEALEIVMKETEAPDVMGLRGH